MAEPAELQIGAVLSGTYQITALLGRGGMGAVWSANHLRLPGKRVAIKVLHAANQGDEGYARFRREAEIASRIGHPNIVEVLDWNVLPSGAPYLVLEYLAGESLTARLEKGRIPTDEAMLLIRQIGSALHAAHRAGVVHRDLKPDNIFLLPTDSGGHLTHRIKILDFGISKIRNAKTFQTQEQRVLGTPQYMAPEQATGKNADIDERTDVFALGAIVYEMLSGRTPFDGENVPAIIFKVVYEEPEPLAKLAPEIAPAVIAAVHKAMSKKREDRQRDVLTFVAEVTGKPLDTLDRAAIRVSKSSPTAYAATESTDVASTQPRGQVVEQKRGVPMWAKALGLLAVAGAGAAIAVVATRPGAGAGGGGTTQVPAAAPRDAGAGAPTAAARDGGGPIAVAVRPTTEPSSARPADAGAGHADGDAGSAPLRATDAGAHPAPPPSPDAGARRPAPPPDAGLLPTPPKPPKPPQPPPRTNPVKPNPAPEPADEKEEVVPAGPILTELLQAEKALAGGDYNGAIRMAKHTLMERKTGHAWSIIARGYCGLRDIGGAKAALQNVPGRERPRVFRKCAQSGFPIN